MNEYASELGMNNTSFNNASGLPDPLNVTSAYDLALLTGELIKNFPDHYRHYSQKSFEFNGIKQKIEINFCGETIYLMVLRRVIPNQQVIVLLVLL